MQLEHNSTQMKEQVMYMQDDWKREQGIVTQMEKDLKFKEEQLERVHEANAGQGAMISDLDRKLKASTIAFNNLQMRGNIQSRTKSNIVDHKDLELANKAAKTIEDLEKLLHQRTDEFEQCMNDLSVFEQTVQTLE